MRRLPSLAIGDVVELLPRVEHDRDHFRRVGEERCPDFEVRTFENRHRAIGEVGFGRAFEQHGEVIGQLAMEAAVQVRLFVPRLQLLHQPRMAGGVDERAFVRADCAVDIAHLVEHGPEHE